MISIFLFTEFQCSIAIEILTSTNHHTCRNKDIIVNDSRVSHGFNQILGFEKTSHKGDVLIFSVIVFIFTNALFRNEFPW